MRSLTFAFLAMAVGQAVAMPVDDGFNAILEKRLLEKRQGLDTLVMGVLNRNGGKVADPPGFKPKRVVLESRTNIPGAQTIKIRYGPYKVPNMGFKNLLGDAGTLYNYPDKVAPRPCEGACTIEYANGTNANIDTGMWLHHMVLVNIGEGRQDATCMAQDVSLPHQLVGANSRNSERLFSSGNERTLAVMPSMGVNNVGYKLNPEDKFALIVDLMNDNMEDKVVYLTITYDVIQGHPENYDDMKPIWFDLAQCSTSEVRPPQQNGSWTKEYTWESNLEGEILGGAGHLHDGGVNVELLVDGQVACDSGATYGGSPEFFNKNPMGHPDSATEHISKMTICQGDTFKYKELKPGQKWVLKAYYDYSKFKGNLHDSGMQENVMGIAIIFVRVKKAANVAEESTPLETPDLQID